METTKFNEWPTFALEDAIMDNADVYNILYQAKSLMTEDKYRELLVGVADRVITTN